MLVATALTLIMMAFVARCYSECSERGSMGVVIESSCTTERERLVSGYGRDLSGLTVSFKVPISPEEAVGYFEYIEGTRDRMKSLTGHQIH